MNMPTLNARRCSYTIIALTLSVGLQSVAGGKPAKQASGRSTQHHLNDRKERLQQLLAAADLAKVSDLFAWSKNVQISHAPSGNVRILVGAVSEELLRTEIRRIALNPTERYNATDAIAAIEQVKEVRAKLETLGLELPVTAIPGARQEADRRAPHLPPTIKNVTLEEALDLVAETFDRIIIYAQCTENGIAYFDIDVAHGREFEKLARSGRR
jgi:hypothetical protein